MSLLSSQLTVLSSVDSWECENVH